MKAVRVSPSVRLGELATMNLFELAREVKSYGYEDDDVSISLPTVDITVTVGLYGVRSGTLIQGTFPGEKVIVRVKVKDVLEAMGE